MVPVVTAPSTRDKLVSTARSYLDDEGVDGIGLRVIARRAGLSHGAPLRHFPTLAALLAAVAADGFRDLYREVDGAVRSADAADAPARLAAAADGYLRFAMRNAGVFSLMFRRDLCDTDDPDYRTAGGMAFGQLVALTAEAQAAGLAPHAPAPEVAGALWALVHGLASLHLLGALAPTTGQSDPVELLHLATSLVLLPTPTDPRSSHPRGGADQKEPAR